MITYSCLVGCKHDSHHKYCSSYIGVLSYDFKEVKEEVLRFTEPLTQREKIENKLKSIVEKFNLDVKVKDKKKTYERYCFMHFISETFHYSLSQIQQLLKIKNYENVVYGISKHLNLQNNFTFIAYTENLRNELKNIKL